MNLNHNYIRNVFISLTILSYNCGNADNDLKIDYPPGGYEFSKNITNKFFFTTRLLVKYPEEILFILLMTMPTSFIHTKSLI